MTAPTGVAGLPDIAVDDRSCNQTRIVGALIKRDGYR